MEVVKKIIRSRDLESEIDSIDQKIKDLKSERASLIKDKDDIDNDIEKILADMLWESSVYQVEHDGSIWILDVDIHTVYEDEDKPLAEQRRTVYFEAYPLTEMRKLEDG